MNQLVFGTVPPGSGPAPPGGRAPPPARSRRGSSRGSRRSAAGSDAGSAAPAAPPAAGSYDRTCESMWELLSSFLADHLFYTARESALAEHVRLGKTRALVDCYQSLLGATINGLSAKPDYLRMLWDQFFEYSRKIVPAMRHDSVLAFTGRVAQAFTPLEYLQTMSPETMTQFTLRAFRAVVIRAYEHARTDFASQVLLGTPAVVDEMRDRFNEVSRTQRLVIGGELSSRGAVNTTTPYDDAARHIRELMQEVRRLGSLNERLAQRVRVAEVERDAARLEAEASGRKSAAAASQLLAHAQEQLAARRSLASENGVLRRRLAGAESAVSVLREDAQSLLNIARFADSMPPPQSHVDPELSPDDSVSVLAAGRRAAAPATPAPGSGGESSGGESDAGSESGSDGGGADVAQLLSSFDDASQLKTFERDFG